MFVSLLLLLQTPSPSPFERGFTAESSLFGEVVSAAGDQDGDGVPDFLLGELHQPTQYDYIAGLGLDCWLISGREGRTLGWFRVFVELDGAVCEFGSFRAARDSLVLSMPVWGGEGCRITLVDAASGIERWHTSAHRGEGGRVRAHLFPDSADPGVRRSSLDLALLSAFSCVRERIEYSWTHPPATPVRYGGVLVIQDLLAGDQREFELLSFSKPPEVDERQQGTRYRGEREQFSRAPQEWGGPSGRNTVVGDLDLDGFAEIAGFAGEDSDQVLFESGRTGEVLCALSGDLTDDEITMFGTAVSNFGDADADGISDLVISELDSTISGCVTAFSGATGQKIWDVSPPFEAAADDFGNELAPVGDVDADGVPDLIVGTSCGRAQLPGYAALLSGRTGKALLEFRRGPTGVVAGLPDPTLSWLPPRPSR